ncbi:MAG: hypothetical protein K0S28_828 [Paucimonas sp.]|jgi:hypothetical protein|nr:hypothetical protein [Paucimonas sp.]
MRNALGSPCSALTTTFATNRHAVKPPNTAGTRQPKPNFLKLHSNKLKKTLSIEKTIAIHSARI